MHHRLAALLHCAAVLTPIQATAQQSTASVKPSDATVAIPEIQYHSAFAGYSRYRDQMLAPWRELNDEAHKAGGHIGIFGSAAGKPPAQHPPGHKK